MVLALSLETRIGIYCIKRIFTFFNFEEGEMNLFPSSTNVCTCVSDSQFNVFRLVSASALHQYNYSIWRIT